MTLINAKHIRFPILLPIHAELWHYTNEENIPSVKEKGLIPTSCSMDGIHYGENRIYFSLPHDGDVCSYLKNREIISFYNNGQYIFYRDTEYDWYYGTTYNPMLYIITNSSIAPEYIVF